MLHSFSQYIKEKYINSIVGRHATDRKTLIDIYKNPDHKEFREIMQSLKGNHKSIRLLIEKEGGGDVWAFNAELLHNEVIRHMKIDEKGLNVVHAEYKPKHKVVAADELYYTHSSMFSIIRAIEKNAKLKKFLPAGFKAHSYDEMYDLGISE